MSNESKSIITLDPAIASFKGLRSNRAENNGGLFSSEGYVKDFK